MTEDRWTIEKEEFLSLLSSVKRPGIGNFIEWLENETDFFIAPSSVNHHDAVDGGLLHHSLKVYTYLTRLSQVFKVEYNQESLIIIALLHDICKVNFYSKIKKSLPRRDPITGDIIPNEWGKPIWDEHLIYEINDWFPLGHGEKSVILILQHGLLLTNEEIMAIRWHMMAYDDVKGSYAGNIAITNASEKYRIVPLVHIADLAASFLEIRESEPSQGVI